MHVRTTLLAAAAIVGLTAIHASATAVSYGISGNGAQEVNAGGTPNQGDPDGSAVGFITLDNGTGSGNTGSATINVTLANLDVDTIGLRGHHIHQNVAGLNGPIVLDFGDPDTIRTGNVLSGTITGLSATTITSVFANPTGFYYNVHNDQFAAGAVRSQLPEPGTLGLVAAGTVGLLARRRRRRRD